MSALHKRKRVEATNPADDVPTSAVHDDAPEEDIADDKSFVTTFLKTICNAEELYKPMIPVALATGTMTLTAMAVARGMETSTLPPTPPGLFSFAYTNCDDARSRLVPHVGGGLVLMEEADGILDHAKVSSILKERGIELIVPNFEVKLDEPTIVVLSGDKIDVKWEAPFTMYDDDDTFYGARNNKEIRFMKSKKKLLYDEVTIDGRACEIVATPTTCSDKQYGFVVLPDYTTEEMQDAPSILLGLDCFKLSGLLARLIDEGDYEDVKLIMPPFDAQATQELQVDATTLHHPTPNDGWTYLLIHGAKMKWSAEGCKAEGYTVMHGCKGAARSQSLKTITCNQPFLAGIYHVETKSIRFVTYILDM